MFRLTITLFSVCLGIFLIAGLHPNRIIDRVNAEMLIGGGKKIVRHVDDACCFTDPQCQASAAPCNAHTGQNCDGQKSWAAHSSPTHIACALENSSPSKSCDEESNDPIAQWCGIEYDCVYDFMLLQCADSGDGRKYFIPDDCKDNCPGTPQ